MPSIPFPDIDPYAELTLENSPTVTPQVIRSTYRRLCLKYHPDKLAQRQADDAVTAADLSVAFERVQFAYSILNDIGKRKIYDATKSVRAVFDECEYEGNGETAGFWAEFFKQTQNEITTATIEDDRVKYQGSEEERIDVIKSFAYYGDFQRLFEVIPHLEFTREAEARIYAMVALEMDTKESAMMADDQLALLWAKYRQNRLRLIARELKRSATEAREAKAAREAMGKKALGGGEADLQRLIRTNKQVGFDSLIEKLESKYGKSEGKRPRTKPKLDDLADEDFDRVQREMLAKRAKGKRK